MPYAFTLPDTAGTPHAPGDAPVTVVVFTCNHCPYALAWHERLIAVARDVADRGVRTLHVCSNDAERFPADGPERMAERVAAGDFDGVPYLHDATQEVARAFGAEKTPDVFVLGPDLELLYRGAPDGAYDDPAADAAWLRAAIDAALEGRPSEPTPPVGCSIKWRS
jgi:hypothetical protein